MKERKREAERDEAAERPGRGDYRVRVNISGIRLAS